MWVGLFMEEGACVQLDDWSRFEIRINLEPAWCANIDATTCLKHTRSTSTVTLWPPHERRNHHTTTISRATQDQPLKVRRACESTSPHPTPRVAFQNVLLGSRGNGDQTTGSRWCKTVFMKRKSKKISIGNLAKNTFWIIWAEFCAVFLGKMLRIC